MLECMVEVSGPDRPHYRVRMPISRQKEEEEHFPNCLLHGHRQVTEPKLEGLLRYWLSSWRRYKRRG